MNISKLILATLALALATTFSYAGAASSGQDEPMLYVIGTGGLSCGKWAEARRTHNEPQVSLFQQWGVGWVVSYNYYASTKSQPVVAPPDLETVALWLDTYCSNNPTDAVVYGLAALVEKLGGKRASHTWKK